MLRQLPSPAWSRGARGVVYDNIIMVHWWWWCVCVCVYALESVSVTAGARSMGRARHGLWTATERRLRRRWRRTATRPSPLRTPRSFCGPPTGARVDVARAGQWLSRDRPHPHTTPITITNNVCGVVLLLCARVCVGMCWFFFLNTFFQFYFIETRTDVAPSARAV